MRELTTAQIAAMVGKSERQVQRWIKSGKLSAQHVKDSRYSIDESVLDDFIEPSGLSDIQAQLELLDYRLNALTEQGARIESLLQELLQGAAKTPGAARVPRSGAPAMPGRPGVVQLLPDGAVLLHDYAMRHGIATATARDQALKSMIQIEMREKPGRKAEQERYVLPEQQKAIIEIWRYNARFQPCTDEHCACRELS